MQGGKPPQRRVNFNFSMGKVMSLIVAEVVLVLAIAFIGKQAEQFFCLVAVLPFLWLFIDMGSGN